jgi:hypothetical protein
MALISLITLLLTAIPTNAPRSTPVVTAPKVRVYLVQEGQDSIGKAVSYFLREEIHKSNQYELVENEAAADYEIDLVSIDVNESINGKRGEWSAISVVFATKRAPCTSWIYTNHGIEIVGKAVVKETALSTLSNFDAAVHRMR